MNKEIEIRKFETKHVQSHYEAVLESLGELNQWFTWAVPRYSQSRSAELAERQGPKKHAFAIVDKADDTKVLGMIGLNTEVNNGEKIAYLSYWCRNSMKRQHITKKAVQKMKEKAFGELGIKCIYIDIGWSNQPSISLAESVGACQVNNIIVKDGHGLEREGIRYALFPTRESA